MLPDMKTGLHNLSTSETETTNKHTKTRIWPRSQHSNFSQCFSYGAIHLGLSLLKHHHSSWPAPHHLRYSSQSISWVISLKGTSKSWLYRWSSCLRIQCLQVIHKSQCPDNSFPTNFISQIYSCEISTETHTILCKMLFLWGSLCLPRSIGEMYINAFSGRLLPHTLYYEHKFFLFLCIHIL